MNKKLLVAVAPVLVLVALAVMPALAQAVEPYGLCSATGTGAQHGCPAGEKLTEFTAGTKIDVIVHQVSADFKAKTTTETITCKKVKVTPGGQHWVENKPAGAGKSEIAVTFSECKVTEGALEGCEPNGTGEIAGVILDEVTGLETVADTIKEGFPVSCNGTKVGKFEGLVVGKQPAKQAANKFSKSGEAKGETLKFAGEKANLTGEIELWDEEVIGTPKVFI